MTWIAGVAAITAFPTFSSKPHISNCQCGGSKKNSYLGKNLRTICSGEKFESSDEGENKHESSILQLICRFLGFVRTQILKETCLECVSNGWSCLGGSYFTKYIEIPKCLWQLMSLEQFCMVQSDRKTRSILRNWLNGKSSGDAFNQTKMVKSGWRETLDTSSLSPPLPTIPVVTADLRFSETFCILTFPTNTPGIPWPFSKAIMMLKRRLKKVSTWLLEI